jgi:hypothetical protein
MPSRIRAPETRFVPDRIGEFDHVDVVMVGLWVSLLPKRHAVALFFSPGQSESRRA